jgi:hypothetical protein
MWLVDKSFLFFQERSKYQVRANRFQSELLGSTSTLSGGEGIAGFRMSWRVTYLLLCLFCSGVAWCCLVLLGVACDVWC